MGCAFLLRGARMIQHVGEAIVLRTWPFHEADQLFIDPVECIDCGACVPACPVSAIFAQDDLPEKWAHFTEKNAAHFGR